ncbi:hypothetical protein F5Y15DRAFT_424411 [Xylariaceae sp. FL0016]|nr:hypothetical protein F5Y15DRAFT_424411 [Xylariaceae sp. FL0016]
MALVLAHIFGLTALHGMLYRTGYISALLHLYREGPYNLPDSSIPILTYYTGIKPLDKSVTLASVMFAGVTDGSRPQLSLYAVHFGGQYLAILVIIMVEGMRKGNQSNSFRFFSLWGCIMQVLSYGLMMPVYGILHLLTSPTASEFGSDIADMSLSNDPVGLQVVPEASLIGYVVPSILMSLPYRSSNMQQWFGGLWQGCPVWMMAIQKISIRVTEKGWKDSVGVREIKDEVKSTISKGVKFSGLHPPIPEMEPTGHRIPPRVYSFAFSACIASQLGTLAFLGVVRLLPGYFPHDLREQLTLPNLFMPPPFYSSKAMESMGAAMHNFFLYDQYVGSTSAIIWASALYIKSREGLTSRQWMRLAGVISMLSLVSGPAGAVVWLIWERDQILLETTEL